MTFSQRLDSPTKTYAPREIQTVDPTRMQSQGIVSTGSNGYSEKLRKGIREENNNTLSLPLTVNSRADSKELFHIVRSKYRVQATHKYHKSIEPEKLDIPIMILPQVHLRKPCYDFYFL